MATTTNDVRGDGMWSKANLVVLIGLVFLSLLLSLFVCVTVDELTSQELATFVRSMHCTSVRQ